MSQDELKIEHCDCNHIFEGYIGPVKVCELFLYDDYNGLFWLNGIFTEKGYKRKGYATQLIIDAIENYGEVYVSTAPQCEHNDHNDDTARYLSDEGASLVNKLVSNGILKDEWLKNPFRYEEYDQVNDELEYL